MLNVKPFVFKHLAFCRAQTCAYPAFPHSILLRCGEGIVRYRIISRARRATPLACAKSRRTAFAIAKKKPLRPFAFANI
jgi:hypothetical protein